MPYDTPNINQIFGVCILNKNVKLSQSDLNGRLCYDFGTDRYLKFAPKIYINNVYSITAWIKLRTHVNTHSYILEFGEGIYNNMISVYIFTYNNMLSLSSSHVNGTTGFGNDIWSNTPIRLNTWCFVSTTYDGINLRLWINGIESGSKSMAMNPNINRLINYVGCNIEENYNFDGFIQNLNIYNNVLTQTDLQNLMTKSSYTCLI